jgi:hypothetical protein
MYDKYSQATLIGVSAGVKLPTHKAVMLLNNAASHGSNPSNNSFKVIDKFGNAVFWQPTAPSNAVKPFTIIPIEIYSYDNAIAGSVSVYLLN